jgi:methanogenic corrinoid protein MtbC1
VFCLEKAITDVAMRVQGNPAVTQPLGSGLISLTLGETHSLGAKVVTQKLALEGWSAHFLADPDTLQDRARREFYHFIGISVGHDEALLGLPDTISEIRDISRNRDVKIIAGGAVFDMPPDCYGFLGADLVTTSADMAVRYLRSDVCAQSALHN